MAEDSRFIVHSKAPYTITESQQITLRPRSANNNTSIGPPLSSVHAIAKATGPIRSRPSLNSFFEASKNVQISGANFHSVRDHHTSSHNVIINLYGNSRVEDAMEILRSDEPIEFSRSNTVSGRNSPRMTPYPITDFVEWSARTPVGQPTDPSQTDGQLPSESPLTIRVHESPEVYYRQLITKRRGSPLWVPEPNDTLPVKYQRRGIEIGDVGIITDFGGFEYMFNICAPKDDPINPGAMPEDFYSLNPPLEPTDIREYSEFDTDGYLASSVVRIDPIELTFVSTASEGALVVIPNGSKSNDLANVTAFMKYASANVEKWYKYAKEACGYAARNGDLRLVVGHDKATAWGLTSFTNVPEHYAFRFKFKPISENSFGRIYGWEYHGTAEARSGPDIHQVEKLVASDQLEDSVAYENQCLFVRTLNITFHDNIWERLIAKGIGGDNSDPSQALDVHPSKTINEFLLKKRPSAKIAITQDWDWISVIEMSDSLLPPAETLFARILEKHDVCEEEGIVFLKPKAPHMPVVPPQSELVSAQASLNVEVEEQMRLREGEMKRREDEAARKEQEAKNKELETKRKVEGAEKLEIEANRKMEEVKKKEADLKKKEEQTRRREEKLKAEAEQTVKLQMEAKKATEETEEKQEKLRMLEEETRRREEALYVREEELKRRESEAKKEEAMKKEEEKKQEESRKQEAIKLHEEEEAVRNQEEAMRNHDEAMRNHEGAVRYHDEAVRSHEEAMRNHDEAVRNQEEARIQAESDKRRLDEELKQRLAEERRRQEALDEFLSIDPKTKEEQEWILQQAKYELQAEQIRRNRAEERKRNDSLGVGASWSVPHFPSSSPGTSPGIAKSPSKPSWMSDRHSTRISSTWNTSSGSAWSSSTAKPSTTPVTINKSSTRTLPSDKPRTGSVGPGTYPTGSSPHAPSGLSESEWARRRDDFTRDQQEKFRREQEKMEAECHLRSAGRPLTREEIQEVFKQHERLRTRLPKIKELTWTDFPWPLTRAPSGPDDISMALVGAYFQSPWCPDEDKAKTPKDRIKEHIRRWHPDRFEAISLPRVVESEKEKVKQGAGNVARYLSDLLRKENENSNSVNIFGD